ncbi:MAG: cysteine desulfurase NifS [Clostridiales Family XIII bacterium]|jgi:cysteine desulfurase|nr:cysteine desulfurase NifS [Clostridiales Family XIII bacterium]
MSEKNNERRVYLDYSATTPVKEEVLQTMLPYFTESFGNPSSLYQVGQSSKSAIATARDQVASLIGAQPSEVFFTSSGTEADNWAFIGTAMWQRSKGKHVITTQIEHHALLHSGDYLKKEGFDVTYLRVDKDGFISLEELEKSIREDTTVISIMFANNEIGTIQPIAKIAEIAKKHGVIFHTDAVQALGNVHIDVKELGVDLLSISGHKIYGPKGIGALYIRKGLNLPSFLQGGGQESNKRPGTENLTGIVGFGKAAELAEKNLVKHIEEVRTLRDYFIEKVTGEIDDCHVNGSLESRLPGNANITFKYIEGEAILLLLDMKGISVSTGSACSSASLTPSHVLTAIGVPMEEIHGSIRFTIGDFTTKEDIDYTIDVLKETVSKLRSISSLDANTTWDVKMNK